MTKQQTVDWMAKEIANYNVHGTNSIEWDWAWFKIEFSTQGKDQYGYEDTQAMKNALILMAKQYLELRKLNPIIDHQI